MIDTRTSSSISSSKSKGGGTESLNYYPRWKRINRSKDNGPTRHYYLLESYSKVFFHPSLNMIVAKNIIASYLFSYILNLYIHIFSC